MVAAASKLSLKLALVTTARSLRSGIGDYTGHLLPYLREHCDVRVFVGAGEAGDGEEDVQRMVPAEHDRILYQLGNELHHSFMPRMIRAIGGTVMLHDWVLFDMSLRAFPALERGGPKGMLLALREGGIGQAKLYVRNWLDRRKQRDCPPTLEDVSGLQGTLLRGWHAAEEMGRWCDDFGVLRLPGKGCREVAIGFSASPGRKVSIECEGQELASHACTPQAAGAELVAELNNLDEPIIRLRTDGIRVLEEQRKHGDSRRLGAFVSKIAWTDRDGSHELDLQARPARALLPIHLSRDRFELPFNNSVVRFADAFIVHSEYVKQRILRERNALTPIAVLHHGSERRWHSTDKQQLRSRLGLSSDWAKGFLVVSFGGVQPHKRIDRVLEAIAVARAQRNDIRLVLAGGAHGEGFDPAAMAKSLGIGDAVHITGYLEEKVAWDWIHAGDVSVNLRGPTSGGTSGGIFQALSLGRPVIASDAAEQSELPNSCIPKVPLGAGEVESLAQKLIELRDNPDRLSALEDAAKQFVESECHWSVVAKQYAEYLDRMPGPRITRKGLISLQLGFKAGKRPVSHWNS